MNIEAGLTPLEVIHRIGWTIRIEHRPATLHERLAGLLRHAYYQKVYHWYSLSDEVVPDWWGRGK